MVFFKLPNVPKGTVFAEKVTFCVEIFKPGAPAACVPGFLKLKIDPVRIVSMRVCVYVFACVCVCVCV